MSRAIYFAFVVPVAVIFLLLSLTAWQPRCAERTAAIIQQVASETEATDEKATAAKTASPEEATAAETESTVPGEPEPAATEPTPAGKYDKATVMLGGGPEQAELTPEEQQFVELINKERKARDIPEVTVAPLLVKTARAKSREMHDLNYWGHESPDKKRRTAMYRVLDALPEQPKTMLVGENLYFCTEVLVDSGHMALMNSPTHRKNILNPEYKYLGIGAYIAKDKRFWVTEHFVKINY